MSSSDKGGLVKSSSSAGLVLAKDPLLLLKHKDKPKIAVEEEEFTETIGKIIRRDFFPELPKLEAQLAFIEATESNDHDKLREISERYPTHIKTPNATPSTFQTPLPSATPQIRKRPSEPGAEEGISKVPRPEDAPSLDSFLSTYQSEDDASFDGIMKLEEEKRLEKYAWMYEREQLAREMNTISPSLTSGDGPKPVQGVEAKAITDGNEAHKDGRGQIKMWDYTAKNTLMYIPDGVSETTKELIRKKNDKIIRHGNTRLSSEFLRKMSSATGGGGSSQISVPESAKEKVGIDGKALHVNDSPQVNGYGFVATPQIRPGVDASPMMTWGTVEGTPLHISTDITPTPGPVFKIPKTPRRDALAHQLAEKASKSLREKKRIALEKTSQLLKSPLGRSPSGSSTVERLKLLSPAARKLVSSSPGTGIFKGTDRSLRASYTPTRSASASSRNFDTGSSKPIPKQHGNESLSSTSAIPHSLTDNLLDLSNS